MATVTGSVKGANQSGAALGELRVAFYLPEPGLSTVTSPGRITVTEPAYATPDGSGSFSVSLQPTDDMTVPNAHYLMRLEWLSGDIVQHVMDFPEWEIRVPAAGGSLEDITVPGNGRFWNQRVVWVSLTAPPIRTRGMLWLLGDPNDPDNPNVSHSSWHSSWISGDLLEWV